MESSFCGKVEYVDTVCDLREYVRLEGTKETLEVPGTRRGVRTRARATTEHDLVMYLYHTHRPNGAYS